LHINSGGHCASNNWLVAFLLSLQTKSSFKFHKYTISYCFVYFCGIPELIPRCPLQPSNPTIPYTMPRQARREYTIAERQAYLDRKMAQYNQRGYIPPWAADEARALATGRYLVAPTPNVSPSPSPRPTPAITPVIPDHILNQLRELAIAADKKYECPICMEDIPAADAQMTNCGHHYCAPCLSQLKAAARHERQWTCAVCRSKHSH
jgi:hypothetical protein